MLKFLMKMTVLMMIFSWSVSVGAAGPEAMAEGVSAESTSSVVSVEGAAGSAEEKNPEKKLTVEAIVNKANLMAYYQGDNGKAQVNMIINDYEEKIEDGKKKIVTKNTRTREFNILRGDIEDGGDQNYFVYFIKPADVRKMVFMVHKHADIDKDDDRWLYLPSLDLVKRIAAGDKRTSFVGSDFLYEDVSGRSLQEDKHELIETTDEFYVVKNTPKTSQSVEFSYYNVRIDKKNFMPMKMEFYDSKGKLYRIIESLQVETVGKYPTVVKSKVTDLNKQSFTLMEFSKIEYNIDLADIFTERYLRKPPREAVR
ncbi:MAG: outer membrane lipoprotein-sorting protein [Sedimentisphaerales bacterium]|nr:outer membrane lipoprotein-sorting protein [Sedimentisphaerales bacterium]